MYDYSILMIHNPARHNEENKGLDPILKIYKDSLITLLSSQNRLSRNQISEIMNAETWLNADTAVNKGFADEIIKVQEVFSGELEGIYELEDEEMRNETNILYNWKKFDKILNQATQLNKTKNKQNKMVDELKKILNLDPNASEEQIINSFLGVFPTFAVKNDDDKSKEHIIANDEDMDIKNDDDMDDKCNDDDEEVMNEELGQMFPHNDDENDIKNDESEVKNDDEEGIVDYKAAYNKLKAEKVANLIENAIKSGKFEKENASIWTEMAMNNYDSTVKVINTLPSKDISPKNVNKKNESLNTIINKEESVKELEKVGIKIGVAESAKMENTKINWQKEFTNYYNKTK
jgi:hypothetical protein